jgi:hypothetical protein
MYLNVIFKCIRAVYDKAWVLPCVITGPPMQWNMNAADCRIINHCRMNEANARLGFHHHKIMDLTPVKGRSFVQKLDRECQVLENWVGMFDTSNNCSDCIQNQIILYTDRVVTKYLKGKTTWENMKRSWKHEK